MHSKGGRALPWGDWWVAESLCLTSSKPLLITLSIICKN